MKSRWAIFLLFLTSRYVQANLTRSNEYRKYNLLLPEFLHDWPYPFTKHCVEKTEPAKAIGENRIKHIDDNDFTVTIFEESDTKEYLQITTNFQQVNVLTGKRTCFHPNI